jgi:hypothetical protein
MTSLGEAKFDGDPYRAPLSHAAVPRRRSPRPLQGLLLGVLVGTILPCCIGFLTGVGIGVYRSDHGLPLDASMLIVLIPWLVVEIALCAGLAGYLGGCLARRHELLLAVLQSLPFLLSNLYALSKVPALTEHSNLPGLSCFIPTAITLAGAYFALRRNRKRERSAPLAEQATRRNEMADA